MLSSGWQSTDDVMPSSPFTMHCVLRSRGYDRADLAERAKEGRSINSCVDLGFFLEGIYYLEKSSKLAFTTLF
jgi:hypothetical protein